MKKETVRHIAFLGGVMGAEESEVHPDALAAASTAIATGVLKLPDGSEAHCSFENEGHWFRTDWFGNQVLSTVHYGPQDDSWTAELISLGLQQGGHINMTALTKVLSMTPIVVSVVAAPDPRSGQLCDIASWIGLALIQQNTPAE